MTKKEAHAVVAVAVALYPHYEVEQATVEAYAGMLADLAFEDTRLAIVEHAATSRMFPSVSELRGLVAERKLNLPNPHQAWGDVLFACADAATGDLAEPVRNALKLIGGCWEVKTTENPEILRAQFLKAYAEIRAAALAELQVEPVAPRELPPKRVTKLLEKAAPRELPA